MKKKYVITAIIVVVFIFSLWLVKYIFDQDARNIRNYEKENRMLELIAHRRELQFQIATYESKLNIKRAKPVPKPAPNLVPKPADPNQ